MGRHVGDGAGLCPRGRLRAFGHGFLPRSQARRIHPGDASHSAPWPGVDFRDGHGHAGARTAKLNVDQGGTVIRTDRVIKSVAIIASRYVPLSDARKRRWAAVHPCAYRFSGRITTVGVEVCASRRRSRMCRSRRAVFGAAHGWRWRMRGCRYRCARNRRTGS